MSGVLCKSKNMGTVIIRNKYSPTLSISGNFYISPRILDFVYAEQH